MAATPATPVDNGALSVPSPLSPSVNPGMLMQLGFSFMASRTLLAAVELGVFTKLAASSRGRLTRAELERELQLHPRGSRDFFDALVTLQLLERKDSNEKEPSGPAALYANSPTADALLDKNKPAYLGGILEMASVRLFRFWHNLPTALRSGQPQNEAAEGGENFFEVLYSDERRLEGFLASMTGVSSCANRSIARQLDCSKWSSFVDAGCAQGDFVVALAQAHPHLKGIGLDLPPVRPIFDKYVAKNSVSSRVEFAAVNFFEAPIPKTDLLFMGHILHDWDLQKKKKLIRAAFDAINDGGAYVLYEAFIDNKRRTNTNGLLMSLNMLVETPGGFDYSFADAEGWLREAGFKNIQIMQLDNNEAAVIARK